MISVKDKKKVKEIIKLIFPTIPYLILIIASIVFVSSYGGSNDMLMKMIKIGLLIFNVFAIYHIIVKVMDVILVILNIRKV